MSLLDFKDFITSSPFKTNSRKYYIEYINNESKNIEFISPKGFQYDRYFMAMFPQNSISYIYEDNILSIDVMDKTNKIIIKIKGIEIE
jgi:hypothetical protein